MAAIPLFFNIEEKSILIVGGGRSAEIKVQTLVGFTKNIAVVAPEVSKRLIELAEENGVFVKFRDFMPYDLKGMALVFAAAEKSVNNYVHSEAKKACVLCCKAEGGGDFILPACKREENLTVAVSTNGKFPMLAKKMVQSIDMHLGQYLDELEKYRRWILYSIEDRTLARKELQCIADCMENPLELEHLLERIGYEEY